MLDIPLRKLARSALQQVFAQQVRLGVEQGHGVLQLVAETEGAS